MTYVILEICDDSPSVNMITDHPVRARHRLYRLAKDNSVLGDTKLEHVIEGKIVGFKAPEGTYSVEILEYEGEKA